MKNALLLLLGFFLLKAGYAQSLVMDNAEMFSAAEEKQLLARIGEVHRNHNGVICLYTVASLDGRDIFEYSMATANSLGVGARGLNNGLLLFIASSERKIKLLVGSGLEWSVSDAVCKTIIAPMMDHYKKNQFLEGTLEGIRLLQAKLGTAYVSVNHVSWEELVSAPGRFAGRVVRVRYPGTAKVGNGLRPEPAHTQFDQGFRLKLEQGKHVLYLRYTKYMGNFAAAVSTNKPVILFARVDENNPGELKLMGVLKDE